MMSKTLLDLDCPPSWPAALLAYLDPHHDLFLRWEARQGEISSQVFDEAIYGLRDALQPYEILGWHCTRLTDTEADGILCNGMQLPNAEMLTRRIEDLVKDDLIAPDSAQRLKLENQANKKYRAGRVWFCFFPPRNAGEDGIKRFFRHWGGDAAALYRLCRQEGETVRKLIDCLIGAVAIGADVPVLHNDDDFDVLARHTDLKIAT